VFGTESALFVHEADPFAFSVHDEDCRAYRQFVPVANDPKLKSLGLFVKKVLSFVGLPFRSGW
jgi:hypothetical protein